MGDGRRVVCLRPETDSGEQLGVSCLFFPEVGILERTCCRERSCDGFCDCCSHSEHRQKLERALHALEHGVFVRYLSAVGVQLVVEKVQRSTDAVSQEQEESKDQRKVHGQMGLAGKKSRQHDSGSVRCMDLLRSLKRDEQNG